MGLDVPSHRSRNLEWVKEGSISVVASIQDWVDEVAVDPDAGVEHLVSSASKHGEETVEWMLGHENGDTTSEEDDLENNKNKENKAEIHTNNVQTF